MKQLLPSMQVLTSNERSKTLFYFFKLQKYTDGSILKRKFDGFGAKCLHWWQCEYTFIGEGEEYWTHAAVFQFSSLEALYAAQESGLSSNDVLDLQLFRANLTMPPRFIISVFKLLRPIGWFYRHSKLNSVESIMAFFEKESKIAPRKDQIKRHLANQRESKAFMINLLQTFEKAQYENENSNISGNTAYFKKYGVTAIRSVIMMGGDLAFSARIGEPLIEGNAPASTKGSWENVTVMQYPNPSKLFELEQMPGYKSAIKHRNAGLERTALIIAN
jgi:uncharacterized protein (DUF1330 family)